MPHKAELIVLDVNGERTRMKSVDVRTAKQFMSGFSHISGAIAERAAWERKEKKSIESFSNKTERGRC